LVPIVVVYHFTHYYTLGLAQVGQLIRLVSDPLGKGWNLFGTGRLQIPPFLLPIEVVWHTQVALIVIGHVASVYLAHVVALRVFAGAREAVISQVPMLVLMMLLTTMGLWILSLPLAAGA
jgi:hypothetical protein